MVSPQLFGKLPSRQELAVYLEILHAHWVSYEHIFTRNNMYTSPVSSIAIMGNCRTSGLAL